MNVAAEETKINNHIRLVHFVINKFYKYHPGIEYEDLFQIGSIGLLQAIRTYQPGHGAKFSTWAVLKIKSRICDALRNTNAKKRKGVVVSLNAPFWNDGCLLDLIADSNSMNDYTSVLEELYLSQTFTRNECNIIQLLLGNEPLDGINKQDISSIKNKIYPLLEERKNMNARQSGKAAPANDLPMHTALDLSEFTVFNASNSIGSRDSKTITIGKSGRVTLSSSIGATFDVGTKIEILINKKANIVVVRQSDNGITCRLNGGQTQGKVFTCKALFHHLEDSKIELPAKFRAEYDKEIQSWVGRR